MVWPAQSPDLNIFENVWLRLKRKLKNGHNTITLKNELETANRQTWPNINVNYIQSLYKSILRRIQRVSRSKGYTTKH